MTELVCLRAVARSACARERVATGGRCRDGASALEPEELLGAVAKDDHGHRRQSRLPRVPTALGR
jgi:hypothetical protein